MEESHFIDHWEFACSIQRAMPRCSETLRDLPVTSNNGHRKIPFLLFHRRRVESKPGGLLCGKRQGYKRGGGWQI